MYKLSVQGLTCFDAIWDCNKEKYMFQDLVTNDNYHNNITHIFTCITIYLLIF